MNLETTEKQLRELADAPTLSRDGQLYTDAIAAKLVVRESHRQGWKYRLTPDGRMALTGMKAW